VWLLLEVPAGLVPEAVVWPCGTLKAGKVPHLYMRLVPEVTVGWLSQPLAWFCGGLKVAGVEAVGEVGSLACVSGAGGLWLGPPACVSGAGGLWLGLPLAPEVWPPPEPPVLLELEVVVPLAGVWVWPLAGVWVWPLAGVWVWPLAGPVGVVVTVDEWSLL
jgi:hypothetical protein